MRKLFVLLFLFLTFQSWSQQDAEDSKSTDVKLQVDELNGLALKSISSDLEQVKILADSSLAIAAEIGYERGKISATYIQGIFFDISKQLDSSRYYFTKGLKMSQEAQERDLEANGLNNLGMMNWNKENYLLALDYFLKAQTIYEEEGQEAGVTKTLSNIGLIYQELKQFDRALPYNFQALEKRIQAGNRAHQSKSYNNLGICYMNLGKYDSADFYYQKSYYLAHEEGLKLDEAAVLSNMANLNFLEGRVKEAISYMKQAVDLRGSQGVHRTSDFNNLCRYYFSIKNFSESEKYGKIGLEYLKDAGDGNSVDLLFNLGNTMLATGRIDEGQKMHELWKHKYDSLFSGQIAKNISELQEKYEAEKKDQEIKALKAEAELKEFQIRQKELMAGGVAIVAVLLMALVYLFGRHRSNKLKSAIALERKALQNDRFKTVLETEEAERKRVARELHDGIGQMLSVVRLFVSDLEDAEKNPKIDRTLKALDQTISEVRTISHNMMPQSLLQKGIALAINELAENINSANNLRVTCSHLDLLQFDENVSIAIYRTIQEVLNNAIKYAHASVIQINVHDLQNQLQIQISDNGQGFNTELIAKSKGIGWSNIFSRMDLIGGHLEVKSEKENGTEVVLFIPQSKQNVA